MTKLVFALIRPSRNDGRSDNINGILEQHRHLSLIRKAAQQPTPPHLTPISSQTRDLYTKCLPLRIDPLSISADFDCDVDTQSDDQQLSVVEVEGRTFTKVTLEGVLLSLCERP